LCTNRVGLLFALTVKLPEWEYTGLALPSLNILTSRSVAALLSRSAFHTFKARRSAAWAGIKSSLVPF
jgi:hypothetical protein